MKNKLQAILFDLDETLFSTSDFTRLARFNAVQAMVDMGLDVPVQVLFDELQEVVSEFSSNYHYHYNKLLLRFPETYFTSLNKTALITTAIIAYHDTKYKYLAPFPDAVNFIEKMYKKNATLGVVTAGITIKQFEKLLRLDLHKYFDPHCIFVSEQIGISKPNTKLYEKACAAMEINPESTMYVGDNPIMDIDPCNKLGMITVLIKKGGKYLHVEGKTKAHYECTDFSELYKIVNEEFELELHTQS
ncbi:TIGR02253 family HAD-type hydrolase [Candidatus Uabimicrobium sp. HlEnr_7]|uniref:TIGR02253 family HAD-type hydrolase n=1 Tax=Candidatus Uabimicrobium helgolandensis TaxID=3095367 RepID=UPI003556B4C7